VVRLIVQWTERALAQLEEVGAYIALENRDAARSLVHRVTEAADQLEAFPKSGRRIPEFPALAHRELIVPPCRVIYRIEERTVWIVHVTRSERILRLFQLQPDPGE
jgi:plasmid stabilization system protein ParE